MKSRSLSRLHGSTITDYLGGIIPRRRSSFILHLSSLQQPFRPAYILRTSFRLTLSSLISQLSSSIPSIGSRHRFHFAFLLLTLSSLISPLSSLKAQCTCPPDSSWQAQYDRANVILLGTCIDITPNTHKGGLNVVFNVDSSWKRAIEPTTTVHTNSPTQCGYPFQRGHRYLVFANKLHQTIATTICEPNQPAEQATQALKQLGPGQAPGRTELASRMNLTLIGLGVLGMLFLAFVVLRKRFMKPQGR